MCLRRVPDTASRIKISPDSKSIDTTDMEFVINPYEEYALEQAVQLKEKHRGEVTVVTVGTEKSTPVILKALALGADKAVHLKVEKVPEDPGAIAHILAEELKQHQFDILLFGKKGVDDDNQQVGQMVSELFQVPCVTQIVKLEVVGGKATVQREVEGGAVIVETSLPAAFTAEKDLTNPRYASLRELIAARKKPIETKSVTPRPSSLEIVSIQPPPPRPPGKIIGKGVEAVPVLVRLLHEEAKVI
ncbi:MAG TPA: electron transfer flavoprotein subunit beta/FixA family protein [Candidatus Bathyarchaeia archaeon]|nr:electron transfer flavoprotein subunit beta/FixA family protein [Candidatus Bathyarchaeia archaeon]